MCVWGGGGGGWGWGGCCVVFVVVCFVSRVLDLRILSLLIKGTCPSKQALFVC